MTSHFASSKIGSTEEFSGLSFHESNKLAAIAMFKSNPVTGKGIGLTGLSPAHIGYEIHNSYLKFMGDGGIFMIFAGLWALYSFGMKKAYYQYGQKKKYLSLVNCYRCIYLSAFLMHYWGWGFRKREMWVVIALIEAVKMLYYPDTEVLEDSQERTEYESAGKAADIAT